MSTSRFSTSLQVYQAFPALYADSTAQPSEESPPEFAGRLAKSASPEDSISFCAYMLDRRKAVWWTCQCLRRLGSPESSDEAKAIEAAETWATEPDELRRRAALEIAMNGDTDLPGIWASFAAGSAGGAMIVDGQPGPPVPDDLTAKAARIAVLVALARAPLKERTGRIAELVAAAVHLFKSP